MSDIVETLRQGSLNRDDYRWIAADEITRLRADNERLRAALELFACDCLESELCKFPHACRNYIARAALEAERISEADGQPAPGKEEV